MEKEIDDQRITADEWVTHYLGQLGSFLKGSGVRRDQAQSGNIPCVRYGEIYTTHHNIVRDFHSHISAEVSAEATRLHNGDLLFAGSGETKEEIGKCVAFVGHEEAYAGGDIIILRPKGVNSAFLGYLLNSPPVVRQKASRGQGDAVVHISAAALGSIQLELPKIDEQERIASALKDIDDLIASLDALIAKKRDIKQATMQQLLTGKTRLPGFKEEWPERKLGTEIKMQVGFPFASRFFNRGGQGTKLVRNRDLHGTPDDTYYAGPFDDDYLITNGDVLVGMDGDFRPCLWTGGGALLNQRVGRIKCKSGRRALFFYYLLEPHLAELEKKIAGTTVKHLSHSDVENITCCFPENLEEQSAIGSLLRDVDNEIEMLEAKLSKAAVLKHGMMQQLLTGRIRLV